MGFQIRLEGKQRMSGPKASASEVIQLFGETQLGHSNPRKLSNERALRWFGVRCDELQKKLYQAATLTRKRSHEESISLKEATAGAQIRSLQLFVCVCARDARACVSVCVRASLDLDCCFTGFLALCVYTRTCSFLKQSRQMRAHAAVVME